MTACERFLHRVSELVERRLEGAELAEASRHLRACPSCRVVRDGVAVLRLELPLLRAEAPLGLAANIVRSVPAPRRVSLTPRTHDLTGIGLRRAAGWIVVFLGAGWLAFAPRVEAFASGRGAPFVAQVRNLTQDIHISRGARDVTAGIGSAGVRLSQAVFGAPASSGEAAGPASIPKAPPAASP